MIQLSNSLATRCPSPLFAPTGTLLGCWELFAGSICFDCANNSARCCKFVDWNVVEWESRIVSRSWSSASYDQRDFPTTCHHKDQLHWLRSLPSKHCSFHVTCSNVTWYVKKTNNTNFFVVISAVIYESTMQPHDASLHRVSGSAGHRSNTNHLSGGQRNSDSNLSVASIVEPVLSWADKELTLPKQLFSPPCDIISTTENDLHSSYWTFWFEYHQNWNQYKSEYITFTYFAKFLQQGRRTNEWMNESINQWSFRVFHTRCWVKKTESLVTNKNY